MAVVSMVKKVCVGSTNKVKIESARAAFTKVFPEESFEFFGGRVQLSQRTTPYDAIMPFWSKLILAATYGDYFN